MKKGTKRHPFEGWTKTGLLTELEYVRLAQSGLEHLPHPESGLRALKRREAKLRQALAKRG